ncbi:hypothetical protein ACFQ9Y_14945 [Peribacillus simplex]|uniref:hypothetical protein n=1 Tax=Peribacillus simplex TaxID=1478 RepID=UPI00366C073B
MMSKTRSLISSPGTRFPRAVREPPQRLCACGVSHGLAFPAGVSYLPFQSNGMFLKKSAGALAFLYVVDLIGRV